MEFTINTPVNITTGTGGSRLSCIEFSLTEDGKVINKFTSFTKQLKSQYREDEENKESSYYEIEELTESVAYGRLNYFIEKAKKLSAIDE